MVRARREMMTQRICANSGEARPGGSTPITSLARGARQKVQSGIGVFQDPQAPAAPSAIKYDNISPGTRKLSFGFVDALVRLCIFFPQLVMYAPPGIWELVLAMSVGEERCFE
jgi:hypothetical protein